MLSFVILEVVYVYRSQSHVDRALLFDFTYQRFHGL